MQGNKLQHLIKNGEESKTKNIRIFASTHELLKKIAQVDNRLLNQELEYLVGERYEVLKKKGRVFE